MPVENPLQADPFARGEASVGASVGGIGAEGQGGIALGPLASDNTNVHVAGIILAALGTIIVLHLLGFRFAVDVGVTS